MADEYLAIGPPSRSGREHLQDQIQEAADKGYEWVGTIASSDGGDFVIMKRATIV